MDIALDALFEHLYIMDNTPDTTDPEDDFQVLKDLAKNISKQFEFFISKITITLDNVPMKRINNIPVHIFLFYIIQGSIDEIFSKIINDPTFKLESNVITEIQKFLQMNSIDVKLNTRSELYQMFTNEIDIKNEKTKNLMKQILHEQKTIKGLTLTVNDLEPVTINKGLTTLQNIIYYDLDTLIPACVYKTNQSEDNLMIIKCDNLEVPINANISIDNSKIRISNSIVKDYYCDRKFVYADIFYNHIDRFKRLLEDKKPPPPRKDILFSFIKYIIIAVVLLIVYVISTVFICYNTPRCSSTNT